MGRKKRSIYDIFFNSNNKSSTSNESPSIRQPTFYVPLPENVISENVMHTHHHRAHTCNNGYQIRSLRSRSVCADNNSRLIFHNIEESPPIQQKIQHKKSNSYNPRESLEITSFLFSKLRMNSNDGEKSATFSGRQESSIEKCGRSSKRVSFIMFWYAGQEKLCHLGTDREYGNFVAIELNLCFNTFGRVHNVILKGMCSKVTLKNLSNFKWKSHKNSEFN